MLDEGFVSFDSACYTVRIMASILDMEKYAELIVSTNPTVIHINSLTIMASILDMEKYAELIVSTNREKITRFIQTGFLELEDVFLLYELIDMTDNYIKIQE